MAIPHFMESVRFLPPGGPLGWVVGATFLHFVSLYYLFSTLPLYVLDVGGSTFQAGLIMGIFSLASLSTRPFFGAWMDRAGRRRFLLIGAGIYTIASLGYLVIPSVPGLLLWRAFHAMGLSTFSTAAASVAGDLAPSRQRGTTMGVYGLAQAGALSVGPGLGAAIHQALGYTGLFLATAFTALAALLCAMPIPETTRRAAARPSGERGANRRASLHQVGPSAATQFAASIAYGTIISFIAVVARDRGLDVVGAYFALLALSSLGIRLVAGRAYDTLGPRAVLIPAFLALSTGMTLLALTTRPAVFLAAAVLAGAGIGSTHTTLLARVVDGAPVDRRGSAVAVFTSCWELGVGGGTILMGRLAETAGFQGMYLAAAALPLIGLAGLPWLHREQRVGSQ